MRELNDRVYHLKEIQGVIDNLSKDKDKIKALVIGYEIDNTDNTDKTKDTVFSYIGGVNTSIGMLERLAQYQKNNI